MSCQKKLAWYELIPVFSFLGLKGRCKNCKTKISIQYPVVEFTAGLIFALLFLKFQDMFFLNIAVFIAVYAYYAAMSSILLAIAVYDFRHKIIPDVLSLILGILAFLGLFFFVAPGNFHPHFPLILEFLSGPIIAAPFALFWLVSSGRWMGLGDAKLSVSLGWLFGFSYALFGVMLAFWIGAIAGIMLVIFSKKHKMKSEIPFAPYLVLGAILAFLFELRFFN